MYVGLRSDVESVELPDNGCIVDYENGFVHDPDLVFCPDNGSQAREFFNQFYAVGSLVRVVPVLTLQTPEELADNLESQYGGTGAGRFVVPPPCASFGVRPSRLNELIADLIQHPERFVLSSELEQDLGYASE